MIKEDITTTYIYPSKKITNKTAYEGGGGAGVRSRSPRGGSWLGGLALSKANLKQGKFSVPECKSRSISKSEYDLEVRSSLVPRGPPG